jgi:hypothetical protein
MKEQKIIPQTPNPIPKNTLIMSDYRGRIRRIRIRERANGTDYNIVVVITGDAEKQEAQMVKVTFVEPIEGPVPSQTTFDIPLTTINPGKDRTRFVFKGLTFKGGDPDELSYTMTATAYNKDKKQLGETYKNDVVVEENCDAPSEDKVS